MSNRLMTREEMGAFVKKIHDEVTAPGYKPPPAPKPENLTKLTDETLETRIMYAEGDHKAGEPFWPLWVEYKRRYNEKKNECADLLKSLQRG